MRNFIPVIGRISVIIFLKLLCIMNLPLLHSMNLFLNLVKMIGTDKVSFKNEKKNFKAAFYNQDSRF